MKRLLIIYHSQSGSTASLAQAAYRGALTESEIETVLCRAFEADAALLRSSDAVVFATPENFGTMSGGLKDFFDRTYYACIEQQMNLSYALLVSAGNDGSGAVRDVDRICKGYPLKKVATEIVVKGIPDNKALQRCYELGQQLAVGLAFGIY
ncbi:hypothetical protein SIN8267_00468 [Sinobacterium norvegicum]|uniref:Flavodoxin-like domain-containing protein n=1 Tax=Sinobacterium norvegicum TaxID=1641715 RepID=A0ABN8EDQ6_9GAMM|nr:NAD(P)H-dependent oxidoreductase [Sinobacterium norvegicum]CAH0990376.1 hypothetical protein SIN8267_00468 [Sinobacterium norvegicum]